VRSGQLPFPSLNEVNYLAFSEISEGYHDELYGYLEEQGWLNEYKQGKTTVPYKKIHTNGTTREQQICMTALCGKEFESSTMAPGKHIAIS